MRALRRAVLAGAGALALGLGAWAARGGELGRVGEELRSRLRHPSLALRRVDFIGLRALEPESLRAVAGLEPGRALLDVDPRAVTAALERHPRIARARATRLFPDRLVIGIREREPVAVDALTLEGIDTEGARFPLETAQAEGLPRLAGDALRGLEALAAATALEIELVRIETHASGVDVEPAGAGPRLRLGADPARDLASWLRLHASGLLARHRPREIDLRFEGSAVLRDFEKEEEADGSQR